MMHQIDPNRFSPNLASIVFHLSCSFDRGFCLGNLGLFVSVVAFAAVWQAEASTRVTSDAVDPRFAVFDFLKNGMMYFVVVVVCREFVWVLYCGSCNAW